MWGILLAWMVLGLSVTNGEVTPLQIFETGNEQFTGNFMNEVVAKNPGKSVIVSAYSILFPLAQLSLASDGNTRKEILTATGLPKDDAKIKEAFIAAASQLGSVRGVNIKIANKIYVTKSAELNKQFAIVSKDVFKSEVENVDFEKGDSTANAINQWVESKTNNRIKNLVNPDKLDRMTRVLLVNAIYFKGKWHYPFQAANTKELDFHVTKEKTQKVPMMYHKQYFMYAEDKELNAKLLSLPYGGKQASLLVVLPNEIDGVDELVKKLQQPENLERAVASMRNYQVIVNLPKFKIETTTDLKELLPNLGIKTLFNNANLNKLLEGPGDLTIDAASQKVFIEVNEEGSEAAGANVFQSNARSARVIPTVNFNADRPFFFAIRHKTTTLFSGVYKLE